MSRRSRPGPCLWPKKRRGCKRCITIWGEESFTDVVRPSRRTVLSKHSKRDRPTAPFNSLQQEGRRTLGTSMLGRFVLAALGVCSHALATPPGRRHSRALSALRGGSDVNSDKRVLVTGGAGYIGSHTCLELLQAGEKVMPCSTWRGISAWAKSALENIALMVPRTFLMSQFLSFINGLRRWIDKNMFVSCSDDRLLCRWWWSMTCPTATVKP